MQTYDLVFVGSGLSSTATLNHILLNLQKQNNLNSPKKIAVIEKSGQFWTGIAYGNRTSLHSLTINPVKDFFQDNEKPIFFNWLNDMRGKDWPGITDAEKSILINWLKGNADKLNDTDLDGVYIPRFLYGFYLTQKMESLVADCKAAKIATVELITGEAVDAVKLAANNYTIDIQSPEQKVTIGTNILVLSTGCLDVRKINNNITHQHLSIDDVYYPTLEVNLKKIAGTLEHLAPDKRNIMIIGSNASASEMVHILCKDKKTDALNKVLILSGSGLPDRLHVNSDYDHILENLKELEATENYTADALMKAIELDVANATKHGLSVGKIHYSLSDRVFKIQQNKLSAEEAMKFFDKHAWAYTRITRRTSENYYFTEKELTDTGKLHFVKGRFVKLCDQQSDTEGLTFIYKGSVESVEKEFGEVFPIIINCSGSELITDTTTKLIRNMLDKDIVKVNANKMGLAVDENFAANNNLYIIGPLLAGIYTPKYKFWHLENAKRLNGLAPILSSTISAKML